MIDRIISFDQMVLNNVSQTLQANVERVITIYQGLPPYFVALQLNYTIPRVYPDFLWYFEVVSANTSTTDFNMTCTAQCVMLTDFNGYHIMAAYVSPNTTSSIDVEAIATMTNLTGTAVEVA